MVYCGQGNMIPDESSLQKELKEKFLRELPASEKIFFLKTAREAITSRGYPACEDLFYYCYFLTLKERMQGFRDHRGEGFMRFLMVEGTKRIDDEIRLYAERLERKKKPQPDVMGLRFIEFFSQ